MVRLLPSLPCFGGVHSVCTATQHLSQPHSQPGRAQRLSVRDPLDATLLKRKGATTLGYLCSKMMLFAARSSVTSVHSEQPKEE